MLCASPRIYLDCSVLPALYGDSMKPDTCEEAALLTPEQVAKQLVVEPTTLAVWRSTKRQPLPFVKIGTLVRYRPEDVAAFIKGHVHACA